MMPIPVRRLSVGLLLVVPGLALTGCGADRSVPRAAGTIAPPVSAPLDTVVALLNEGDEKTAQKQLKALLKDRPNDPQLRVLAESLDGDPVSLLGARSFAYTVQPGDTMIALSQRFLGNRLKFYQLARYNKVDKPVALAAGTVLHIPGDAPAAQARSEPVLVETIKTRSGAKVRPRGAAAATAAPPAKSPVVNPTEALRLRGLGLAALNQGRVADAVGLLRHAASLDPANPLIARDLARAVRIAHMVQVHR